MTVRVGAFGLWWAGTSLCPLQKGRHRMPEPAEGPAGPPLSGAFAREDFWCGLHLAAGDAELVDQLQFAPQLRAADLSGEELLVTLHRAADFVGVFRQEFHAERACAELDQPRGELRAGL